MDKKLDTRTVRPFQIVCPDAIRSLIWYNLPVESRTTKEERNFIMGVLSDFNDLLTGIPVNAVLRERINLFKDKLQILEEQKAHLIEELNSLRQSLAEAKKQLAAYAVTEQYLEHRGAAFKRKAGGGFHAAVYCPACHVSTAPFPPGAEYNCSRCNWHSQFVEADLGKILKELPC